MTAQTNAALQVNGVTAARMQLRPVTCGNFIAPEESSRHHESVEAGKPQRGRLAWPFEGLQGFKVGRPFIMRVHSIR